MSWMAKFGNFWMAVEVVLAVGKASLSCFGCWQLWGWILRRIGGVFWFWKKGKQAGCFVIVGVCTEGDFGPFLP